MCTLIVARDIEKSSATRARADLLVGANRDEALDRPSEPPRVLERSGLRLVSPLDKRAGGTWLGINEHGVFAGITNRYGGTHDPRKRSRGEIVFEALRAKTASKAAKAVAGLTGDDYNGFHLVCADAESIWIVWGGPDPIVSAPSDATAVVLTERSLGAARDMRKRRTKQRIRQARTNGEFGVEWLKSVLSQSDGGRFERLCICLEGVNYGTRSSTILEIGEEPRGWHAEGPPCDAPYEDISEMLRELRRSEQ